MDKEVVCIYNEYYSAIKKNEIMPLATTWMDPRDYHTKWSKSERERQRPIWYDLYVESKIEHKWTYYETETDSRT